MFGKDNKMDIRKKALVVMLKKGPMGPGAMKKKMDPMMEELDAMHDNVSDMDEGEMDQPGAEYMQFMVSPEEKDMILNMRKKKSGGGEMMGHEKGHDMNPKKSFGKPKNSGY